MSADLHFECLYCGGKFNVPYYYEPGYALPGASVSCPGCKETKNLKQIAPKDDTRRDVFGYNYKPGDKKRL